MSFLASLLAPLKPKANDPLDERYWTSYGPTTAAGVAVSADSALKVSAVYACVRLISTGLATMPFIVYQRQADGGRTRAEQHPLSDILRYQPNRWQTAFDFISMMTGHLLLRGNSYAYILPGPRGAVDELIPIHPDLVTVEKVSTGLRYQVTQADGTKKPFEDYQIFHLRGLSLDGICGLSVISYARESVGMAMAAESYGARYFSQNAVPSAVLVHPGKVNRDGRERIRDEWQADMAGLDNAHRVAVMAEGIEVKPVGMSNEDSQFLQTREYQVEDIARWFGVPLHMIQSTSKTTSWGTGIESMNLGYKTYTLLPWARMWEQATLRDLIIATRAYYAEFLFDALERGDLASRTAYYAAGRQGGWLSTNEIRRMENMNPIENGDVYLQPLNMAPAGEDEDEAKDEAKDEDQGAGDRESGDRGQRAEHYRAILAEAAGRVVRKEIAALTRAARRAGDDFEAFEGEVNEFYVTHADYVAQTLRMPISTARMYVQAQRAQALRFGTPAVTLAEATAVNGLMALAMEGEHVLE